MFKKINLNNKGFTLIELLLVIAIIAILALLIFVALDPASRFKDARDSRRISDVNTILTAIKINQIDNKGSYLTAIQNASTTSIYMIGSCTSGATSTAVTDYCDTDPTKSVCLNLGGLVSGGYLGSFPISPNGSGTWNASTTGYTLQKATSGSITIASCESENTDEILLTR